MACDVVILSNTASVSYFNLLDECVKSIMDKNKTPCNVIIVETNSKLKGKQIPINAKFIFPEEKFNYNRFLNIGIKEASTDNILISNNDIKYEPECIDRLCSSLEVYDSVSPWDTNHHYKFFKDDAGYIEGTEVGKHVIGYSIMFKRSLLNKIGMFDEKFKFWYQDNDYCNLLNKFNLKHALVTTARCFHYGSQSHTLLSPTELHENTHKSVDILYDKWGK